MKTKNGYYRTVYQNICCRCGKPFNGFSKMQKFCSNKCSNQDKNLIYDTRVKFPPTPLEPEDAYILGLLLTDGCVIDTKHQSYIQIVLQSKDADVLNLLKNRMCPTAKIHRIKNFQKLQIGSRILVKNLRDYGIVPNKSANAQYPSKIPQHLHRFFILGLMDGDGSWSNGFDKDGYKKATASFYGTKELCQSVMNIVNNELGKVFNGVYKDSRKKFLYRICIGSIKRRNKFAHWLYDGHTLGIQRKRIIATSTFTDADEKMAKNIAQLGAFCCKQPRKDVNMLNFVSHIPPKLTA